MITIESIDDIVVNGGVVETADGSTLGSVEQVFLSEGSGDPAFVTVRTGLFGLSESFVPLAGATIDGSRIRVAFDKSIIKNGPRIESDRGAITTDEESELYRYYGTDSEVDVSDVENAPGAGSADATNVTADADAAGTGFGETSDRVPGPPPPPQTGRPGHPGPPLPPHLLKHVVVGHPHHPPVPPATQPPPPPVPHGPQTPTGTNHA